MKMKLEENRGNKKYAAQNLEKEYKALKDKEMKIRAKLKDVEDPKKKKELKALLGNVLKKQEEIKKKAEVLKSKK